jgi:hypothetical protein
MGLSVVAGVIAFLGAVWIAVSAAPQAEMAELRKVSVKPGWGPSELSGLSGPIGLFVREFQCEEDSAARLDKVSERLAEVDIETWDIEKRVGMWARVALFSGVACSIAILCGALGSMQRIQPYRLLLPFTIGATTALGCWVVGRVAGVAATERRRAWDTLSTILLRPLFPEQFSERHDRNQAGGLKSRCHDDA